MIGDQHVGVVIEKYVVPRGPNSPAEQLGATVAGLIRTWAGQQLNVLEYSGSYAKETGVHGASDVDVFISLKSDTTNDPAHQLSAGLPGRGSPNEEMT